jgi:glycosyltransferase involved in cell wall biosynthesis
MKVALHTGQLRQSVPGGIGRYIEGLLAHLPAAGVELRRFDGNALAYEVWHRLRFPAIRAARGVDVIHAPSLALPPSGRRPLVVTVHDLAFLTHPGCFTPRGVAFHRRALRIARREAAAVVVPSRFTGDELIDAGFQPSRIHVAHHGVDAPATPPPADALATLSPGLGAGAQFLLFVGTIEPRKGVDVLLAAHRHLRADWPDLRLVVAGPAGWGETPDLDGKGVIAPGRVAQPVLDALYAHTAALVVPSRTEGFGLPALEAMARGCPVVCSDRGALPEVVATGGLVVPGADRDAEVLAAAIGSVLADDTRRADLANAGRARAAAFTWAASATAHRRAYASALRSRTATEPN